uniref:Uncharacterized protein n=1 Tax=Alexandrium andersonii TaxID=327968 RepID=A0A7S2BJG7_9DINO
MLELDEDDTVVGSKAIGEKMGLSEGMQTPSTPAFTELQAAHGAPLVAVGAEAMADDQFVWNVPRSKLTLTDRSIVSPPFYVQELGEYVQYRAHVTATRGEGKKGGHSLKKAGGRGKLEVQRTKPPPGGEPSEQTVIAFEVGPEQRGPVTHNFAESPLCGLPRDYEEWDFLSHVDAFHYVNIVVKLPGRKVTDKAA